MIKKENSPLMQKHYSALEKALKQSGVDHLQEIRIMSLVEKISKALVEEITSGQRADMPLSSIADKHYDALNSALAHAGVSNIQKMSVIGLVSRIVEEHTNEAFAKRDALANRGLAEIQAILDKKEQHLIRERELIGNAIGGGSEIFMKLEDDYVLDPTAVAQYIRDRRQMFSDRVLKNMKTTQDLENRIKELEEELLEYKGSPKP